MMHKNSHDSSLISASLLPEKREFRMAPALLWSVIESQAGSAEKALLEAIMNAVDAGASRCVITLNEMGYIVQDDGSGFKCREDVEQFFETFGTPHKTDDGAVYGTYRMGRGQLFAFSKTRWETGNFVMEVDIKERGLQYDLHTESKPSLGCKIIGEWYEPLLSSEVIEIDFQLRKLAKWIQIPVYLNDKRISQDKSTEVWTYEDDDAYFRLKSTGGLAVYNLGALVKVFSERDFGISGTLVSKKQLKVNFARNDILISKCNVWKRIRNQLDKNIGSLAVKKKTLSGYEIQALADRFAKGQIAFEDIRKVNLLTDVSGKNRSLNELIGSSKLCVVPDFKDWTLGERVMNQKLAFVLRSSSIIQFGADTAEEFMELLRTRLQTTQAELEEFEECTREYEKASKVTADFDRTPIFTDGVYISIHHDSHPDYAEFKAASRKRSETYDRLENSKLLLSRGKLFDHVKVVSLAEVSSHITDQYNYFDIKKLPPHQVALMKGMVEVVQSLYEEDVRDAYARLTPEEKVARNERGDYGYSSIEAKMRKVLIGDSDVALGWTDGHSYIAVNQEVLRDVIAGKYSISFLVSLLVHEHCHDEPDIGGHIHSMEFYQRFHDLMMLPHKAEMLRYKLVSAYAKAIDALGKKPTQIVMAEIRCGSKKLGQSLADMHAYAASDSLPSEVLAAQPSA